MKRTATILLISLGILLVVGLLVALPLWVGGDRKANEEKVKQSEAVEPQKISDTLYYFKIPTPEGTEHILLQKSLKAFSEKHPELKVISITPDKPFAIGIGGYWVTFQKN